MRKLFLILITSGLFASCNSLVDVSLSDEFDVSKNLDSTSLGEISALASEFDNASSVIVNFSSTNVEDKFVISYQEGITPPNDCESGNIISSNQISGTSHTITGLDYGKRYSVRVCTENNEGELSEGTTVLTDTLKLFGLGGVTNNNIVVDNYLYVSRNGLEIYDISDPIAPKLLSITSFDSSSDRTTGIAIDGNYAYIGSEFGMHIVDIGDKKTPTHMSHFFQFTSPEEIAVLGNYALVTAGASGLIVIDVSDKSTPTQVASYNTSGSSVGVTFKGNHVYIADSGNGVVILDMIDPLNPALLGSYNTPGQAVSITIDGNVAYVADSNSGVIVLDITVPTAPTLLDSYNTAGTANKIHLNGNHAYVADDTNITLLDKSNPSSLTLVSSFLNTSSNGSYRQISTVGSYAYASSSESGLQIIDISNSFSFTEVANTRGLGFTYAIDVDEKYAYITGADTFFIVEHVEKSQPKIIGRYNTGGSDIVVADDYAYIADGSNGLIILDVSSPETPSFVGSVVTTTAGGLEKVGSLIFVADGASGLRIIDVSDPTTPNIVGSYDTPDVAFDVTVLNNHAYIADRNTGVVIVDISNPASPSYVNTIPRALGWVDGIINNGQNHILYNDNGLRVVDVSNPVAPVEDYYYSSATFEAKMVMNGNYLFTMTWSKVKSFDISDISNPVYLGDMDLSSGLMPEGISFVDNYIFIAGAKEGLIMGDVHDPANMIGN